MKTGRPKIYTDAEYRERQRLSRKAYADKNPDMVSESRKKNAKKNINSWRGFIPDKTECECCGKALFFCSGERNTSIHFDHRHGGSEVIKNPIPWLFKHYCNEKNRLIWESCDFGMLCNVCNFRLPTKNRQQFLENAFRYHNGSSHIYATKSASGIDAKGAL
jgi:hypothetical protein